MLQVNLKNRASAQSSESFNSMCKFGSVYLGCTSEGIAKICGFDDNGVEIPMSMKSGVTDFGIGNQKRFRFFYVSGESNGNCKISIYADGVLAKTMDIVPSASGVFDVRVPVSHAFQARYLQWKIENVDGSFVVLYEVRAVPVVLHPGRGRG